MKKLLIIALLMMSTTIHAQSWKELHNDGNSTYLGGYWASVSNICLGAKYTNDSGTWKSGEKTHEYKEGCASALWMAFTGQYEG